MSGAWAAIGLLAVVTFAIRAAGPVALGGRVLPGAVRRTLVFLPAALMAGLVISQTFTRGDALVVDARAGGLVAAVLAAAARLPMAAVLLVAAATTALLRL